MNDKTTRKHTKGIHSFKGNKAIEKALYDSSISKVKFEEKKAEIELKVLQVIILSFREATPQNLPTGVSDEALVIEHVDGSTTEMTQEMQKIVFDKLVCIGVAEHLQKVMHELGRKKWDIILEELNLEKGPNWQIDGFKSIVDIDDDDNNKSLGSFAKMLAGLARQ